MNFAGDILNTPYGPLLKQLIADQSTSLQSKFDSLPKTKFPLYEGSYPTSPSGPLEGSYPQRDGGVFSDPFPINRTMEFRDANSNGIDDRDERGLPNSNGSTFIVPSSTSDADIDQAILHRSGLLERF
tara:strand:+ start:718 stop:1101 length:384 start_codon:yes stop_codon:yes gene_type:complete